MKKTLRTAAALVAAGALLLSGCGTGRTAPGGEAGGEAGGGFAADAVIGVALPQKTSGVLLKLFNEGLSEAGFKATVQFANGGVSGAAEPLAMVAKGASHRSAPSTAPSSAPSSGCHDAGAVVIAYDRLLRTPRRSTSRRVRQLRSPVAGESLLEGCRPSRVRARGTSSDRRSPTTTPVPSRAP